MEGETGVFAEQERAEWLEEEVDGDEVLGGLEVGGGRGFHALLASTRLTIVLSLPPGIRRMAHTRVDVAFAHQARMVDVYLVVVVLLRLLRSCISCHLEQALDDTLTHG